MLADPNTPPNPFWLAFFEVLFQLAHKLDVIEAERVTKEADAK